MTQQDVVAQLRDLSRHPRYHGVTWAPSEAAICGAAADEIERLRTLLSGEQGWRNVLDELLGACQRYDVDPCSTLAIADYLEAKDHAAEVLAAASSAPGSVPTSLAGQGPDGYVLVPRSVIASNDPDTPECIWPISWLRTMVACADEASDKGDDPMAHDEMVREVRRLLDGLTAALQSSPQPTAGGDAPDAVNVPNTEPLSDHMAIAREICAPRYFGGVRSDDEQHIRDVAKALSAERARVIEECAKIAETFNAYTSSVPGQYVQGNENAKRGIAAAIRALGLPKP